MNSHRHAECWHVCVSLNLHTHTHLFGPARVSLLAALICKFCAHIIKLHQIFNPTKAAQIHTRTPRPVTHTNANPNSLICL